MFRGAGKYLKKISFEGCKLEIRRGGRYLTGSCRIASRVSSILAEQPKQSFFGDKGFNHKFNDVYEGLEILDKSMFRRLQAGNPKKEPVINELCFELRAA